jgi:LacI family transcriptional regulator
MLDAGVYPYYIGRVTVTIKQVAQEAQVSYVTALRSMGSSPGRVLPATAERVLAVAERLGYRPNPAARALINQASPYVGVLYGIGFGCNRRIPVSEMMRIYSELHYALTVDLEAREYHVLSSSAAPHVIDSEAGESEVPKLLQQQHVGALVVIGDVWPALHREIIRFRLPAVGIYCPSVSGVPTIDMNYQAAAKQCTQHLLQLGHRRIAFAPGRWKTWKTEPMQFGYLGAMGEADVKPVPCWDQFRESAELIAAQLKGKHAPTAFVVYDDYEAVRTIDLLEAEGRRVPEDVSIVAVQNMGPGAVRRPTVSGCPIPVAPMAQASVKLLLDPVADDLRDPQNQRIDSSLVEADSSGKPRVAARSAVASPN